jgi:hypothetical protein
MVMKRLADEPVAVSIDILKEKRARFEVDEKSFFSRVVLLAGRWIGSASGSV